MQSPVLLYPLAALHLGVSINVRTHVDVVDKDDDELAASITAHGLLQPLIARGGADGRIEIIDGNRRLKALRRLASTGGWNDPVPVVMRDEDDTATAFELSLAANIVRKPLHPVREYEAFAQLVEAGRTAQEVADHFGVSLRSVEQRLALGRLHADVRQAWLDGRINGEDARAFTVAEPAQQAAYLAAADAPWKLAAGNIRRAFTEGCVAANDAMALFVGEEAYRAAGGRMLADLFVEHQAFADRQLLQQLADEKLKAEAIRIAADEGWAEGLTASEAGEGLYSWQRYSKPAVPEEGKPARLVEIDSRLAVLEQQIEDLEIAQADRDNDQNAAEAAIAHEDALLLDQLESERDGLRAEADALGFDDEAAAWSSLSAEQRASAVIVCAIVHGGCVGITRGLIKGKVPKGNQSREIPAAPAPADAPSTDEDRPHKLSGAHIENLAKIATAAAASVLAENPHIAIAGLVAALSAPSWSSPVRIKGEGSKLGPEMPMAGMSFERAFRECFELPHDELMGIAAAAIARELTLSSYTTRDTAPALLAALPPTRYRAALCVAFDPETHFAQAAKPEALKAIEECGGELKGWNSTKKAAVAAEATRLAREHGWLPEPLRGELFAAIADPGEADVSTIDELAGDEDLRTAAEAADQIWRDEDERRAAADDEEAEGGLDELIAQYSEMKMPALRQALKALGVTPPFGATKAELAALAAEAAAELESEEAA